MLIRQGTIYIPLSNQTLSIIEKQFFIKDWILDILKLHQHNEFTEMDASLVGAPVFKTVCVALILSQVGSIPTHLRHFIWKRYIADIM